MISKSETASRLHIYDFDRRLKKSINDARALSVSTDEKILAYATASKEIKMICIKEKEKPKANKNGTKSKNQSRAPSRKGTLVNDEDGSVKNGGNGFNTSIQDGRKSTASPSRRGTIIADEDQVDETVINTIVLPSEATSLQFYGNNFKIAV